MNDALKKAILFGVIALLLFGAGFFGGYIIRKEIDNKRVREYRDTIIELRGQIKDLGNRIGKLAESNKISTRELAELRKELGDAVKRAEQAERIIAEISTGISGAAGDVRDIIRSIRSVISKIEQLGEP